MSYMNQNMKGMLFAEDHMKWILSDYSFLERHGLTGLNPLYYSSCY